MGYKYCYQSNNKDRHFGVPFFRVSIFTIMFFMVFFLLTSYFWPEGIHILKQYIHSYEDISLSSYNCLMSFFSDFEGVKFD